MSASNQDFFEVVEIESNKVSTFNNARDVYFFLIGFHFVFFKVFKNGKEVDLNNTTRKNVKSFLQYA